MRIINGEDFGCLMPGTLVLNKENKIEFVTSLSYSVRKMSRVHNGPSFTGLINGKYMNEYRHLPLTVELLEAIGWTIDRSQTDRIIATPPPSQFMDEEEALYLKVHFLLTKDAEKGWNAGNVIAKNASGNFIDVDFFEDVERLFIQKFARRMNFEFVHNFQGAVAK